MIMTGLIKTSKFLNSLYENECENSEEKIDYDEFINQHLDEAVQMYNIRCPRANLTMEIINKYVSMFETLQLHKGFVKPSLDEYFNKKLNSLLLIDFLISCNRQMGIIINELDSKKIFDFFITLSHFYNFINYLDVDIDLLVYNRYMLVLYLLSLKRDIIEMYFGHIIWELDQFFLFNVVKDLYLELDNVLKTHKTIKDTMKKQFSKELTNYNSDKDYITEYKYLDNYFKVVNKPQSFNNISIERKTKEDIEKEDIENDNKEHCKIENNVDLNDGNYNTYKTQFLYKVYQHLDKLSLEFDKFIKISEIKISDYSKFTEFNFKHVVNINKHIDLHLKPNNECKNKFLTFVGVTFDDYNHVSFRIRFELIGLAYRLCHFDIIKKLVKTQHDINILDNYIKCVLNCTYDVIGREEIHNYLKERFKEGCPHSIKQPDTFVIKMCY